jgi:hypothetical protein
MPDKQPLETYHPETTHLTATCSCEACSAFTRVTACTLALPPIRGTLTRGFSHFVTSMTAPVASGWSVCRACTHWKAPPCHGAHPNRTLALRYPGHAHALRDTLFGNEKCGVVAHRIGKETAASEVGIERKSVLYGGSRLVQFAEQR